MSSFVAIGLGEVLWDVLPEGKKLGGAPANFAYHVNSLGGTGIPVSCIGDDALGCEAVKILNEHGVSTEYVDVDNRYPTGTVDAVIGEDGAATYVFPDDVAWDHLVADERKRTLAGQADAICFGTLAQRGQESRAAIHALLEAAPQALKVYDINLRQNFYGEDRIHASLQIADVLKINDEELAVVSVMFDLPSDERKALGELQSRHDLPLVVLTRGGSGSMILSRDGVSDIAGAHVDVMDTIGAGDSFTAAMALAHLHGWGLEAMHRRAIDVASFVCGHAGAMPILPDELKIS